MTQTTQTAPQLAVEPSTIITGPREFDEAVAMARGQPADFLPQRVGLRADGVMIAESVPLMATQAEVRPGLVRTVQVPDPHCEWCVPGPMLAHAHSACIRPNSGKVYLYDAQGRNLGRFSNRLTAERVLAELGSNLDRLLDTTKAAVDRAAKEKPLITLPPPKPALTAEEEEMLRQFRAGKTAASVEPEEAPKAGPAEPTDPVKEPGPVRPVRRKSALPA